MEEFVRKPSKRPKMPRIERAKQFNPFQPLSGYDAALRRVEEEVLKAFDDKRSEFYSPDGLSDTDEAYLFSEQ